LLMHSIALDQYWSAKHLCGLRFDMRCTGGLSLQVRQISLRPWRCIAKMPRWLHSLIVWRVISYPIFLPLGNVSWAKASSAVTVQLWPSLAMLCSAASSCARCTVGALTSQPLKNMILSDRALPLLIL
jgi:hypothetical protein